MIQTLHCLRILFYVQWALNLKESRFLSVLRNTVSGTVGVSNSWIYVEGRSIASEKWEPPSVTQELLRDRP